MQLSTQNSTLNTHNSFVCRAWVYMPDRGSTYNHIPLPVTSGGLTILFTVASPLPLPRRGDSVIAEEKAINTYYPLFCPYHLWKKATARARSVSSLPLGEGGGRGSHHLHCKIAV